MNRPLVYQLLRPWHGWVAKSGSDKRWKHLSVKHAPRSDLPRACVRGLLAEANLRQVFTGRGPEVNAGKTQDSHTSASSTIPQRNEIRLLTA